MNLTNVNAIVKKAVARNPEDIDTAVNEAEAAVKKLPEYHDLVKWLIRDCIRGLIQDCRHNHNVAIKQQAKTYGKAAKVDMGKSKSIPVAAKSWYTAHIAGRTLGSVLGSELLGLAKCERARGDGYYFNAKLLERLSPLVPPDKTVEQCIPERKINKIAKSINESMGGSGSGRRNSAAK